MESTVNFSSFESPQNRSQSDYAVAGDDLIYSYGESGKKRNAIDRMTIRVPVGSVYGLLGPSGGGKTTFFRCLIGMNRLDHGRIILFGDVDRSSIAIPGQDLGYMPQSASIDDEFTVHEMLCYFGYLNGLNKNQIIDRINHHQEYFAIKDLHQKISSLSGGERNCIPFLCAIIHQPKLVILDEPTCGCDLLLSAKIWDYCLMLSRRDQMTFIVTTHYIQDARHCNVVGFMRHGKLLAENSVENLCKFYPNSNLEMIFTSLCLENSNPIHATNGDATTPKIDPIQFHSDVHHQRDASYIHPDDSNFFHFFGLLNYHQIKKHVRLYSRILFLLTMRKILLILRGKAFSLAALPILILLAFTCISSDIVYSSP